VPPRSPSTEEVNTALEAWRQGDAILELDEFIYVALRGVAKSPGKKPQWGLKSESVAGFAVVSQTCDIVRASEDRPYVELSPLVEVPPERIQEIAKGMRPSYAYLPQLADKTLVVDLDRTLTVEKSLLVQWKRQQGCLTDGEREAFAAALARKRSRFAFEQDFVDAVKRLQKQIVRKHNRDSPDGLSLRSLREIRVLARPSWTAKEVQLEFFFILDDELLIGRHVIAHQIEQWHKLLDLPPTYVQASFSLRALEDMTAQEYVASQKLDLDHLSGTSEPS